MSKRGAPIQPKSQNIDFFDQDALKENLQQCATPAERLQLFKHALEAGNDHLDHLFRQGEDIHTLVRGRSAFIDQIIYHAWCVFDWDDAITLIAVGGYGRGEMHPQSDIDLLFLLRNNKSKDYESKISEFLTLLWDLQLQIGHSVRTIKQCCAAAKDDVTVMTNLLELRTIVGATDLTEGLVKKLFKLWSTEKFFRAKAEEQRLRHNKHGITEFDLEPNVKESPGGLRDIQTIHWLEKHTYQTTELEKHAEQCLYTTAEQDALHSAEGFLWRVRYALHILSSRSNDHLQFEYQRQIADMFGFIDTDERLAVEQFMQRYYQSATTVREITDVVIQLLEERIFKPKKEHIKAINPHFQLRKNHIETAPGIRIEDHPCVLVEVFVVLAQHPDALGIHAGTIREIREFSHLINEEFRANPKHQKLFVELLKSSANLSLALQVMSRYGVLGRYLPAFGKIMGLSQHDLFHIYPVDIHTLAVVSNLRHFSTREARNQFPVSSYTYASYPKPEILTVAGLYHDIAKGRGGDHSELGSHEVKSFARLHGFSPTETRLMAWLVENHLYMSSVAQREDISDPEVIGRFAKHVGDETRLNLLYTLTTADILATNPTLWNSWRASLMRQLYNAARHVLRGGHTVDRQEYVEETKTGATAILSDKGFEPSQYEAFWGELDETYFLREAAEDVAWHTQLLMEHDGSMLPTVRVKPFVNYLRERATVVFVRLPSSPYLFYSVAAAVGNAGLTIQDARLYGAGQSKFLTVYVLNDAAEPLSQDQNQIKQLIDSLEHELAITTPDPEIRGKRTSRQLKQLPVPTRTMFSNLDGHSTLEVVAADRSGLLATIADILLKNDIYLRSAKITTLGERVEDLFIVETEHGEPITDEVLIEQLQDEIRQTIDQRVEDSSQVG